MPTDVSCEPLDDAAIERGLNALRPRLRALLMRLCAASDVDDVLQDAMARCWRYRTSLEPGRPLDGWALKTAFRAFLDDRAKRARDPAALGDADRSLVDRRTSPNGFGHDLERALSSLSDVERSVLLKRHRRGETIREIAAALDMPEGTVKSHLHRARAKLPGGDLL